MVMVMVVMVVMVTMLMMELNSVWKNESIHV
jgi:hypothetical protein